MNPTTTLVVYKAKPGCEKKLIDLIGRHGRTLYHEQLVTERPELVMELGGGCFLELVEWRSQESADKAHSSPEVQKIWEEAGTLADFIPLTELPNEVSRKPFPKVKVLGSKTRMQVYSDNMISAKNYPALVQFYRDLVGLCLVISREDYSLLVDPESGQRLCITNGDACARMAVGISSLDLPASSAHLEKLGGKVDKRWEFEKMRGLNATDPEGNEIMVWQTL